MTNVIELPAVNTEQKPSAIAYFLLLIVACIYGLAPILIRICEQEVSPNAIVFDRFWMTAAIIGVWEVIVKIYTCASDSASESAEPLTLTDVGLFFLAAGFGASNIAVWTWSLTQTNIATANLLHNLTPFFATIGAWFFFGQRFDRKFFLGLVLSLTGAITIGIDDFQISADNLIGDGLALLSAIFYAGTVLCGEKLRAKFSTTKIMFWSCLLRSLWMLPIVCLFKINIFPISVNGWLALISLVVLSQVVGLAILLYYLKRFSAGFVSLFLLFDPILAAILAWLIFGEKLSMINWFALVIVLLGVYLAKSSQGHEKTTNAADHRAVNETVSES
ncbi:DMT family transporter [Aetokthonos hydrillicola Thurmond2011]|jgi:drug/metabolite transporter (DMT)-like permease|uniref:DMT family transporter n=1 Tax=Aetokthonos hydrillicola Thurmond2011 TaxID=2712845 RepID=A0AAP5I905_9CYAN|nr:DMT family transporter [Aetokthonos hydrillicola]MBO3457727.1 DMT family transporter [Aetokthonos hydrillicola CCALA 1050]MBW4589422.1 DMT family transporter [Aetokthonos hydrillicola CCALA 1050]MDR9897101.1 DMT family transporter [Aetokthonos hydrillicola Thurmond2011]